MKPNAPWSVKGIERDARETAKEAARREGLTVGEWLTQMIQAHGDPTLSNGEIVGIKTSDIVTAIELVNKRALGAEGRSAVILEELARSFANVVERVQRLERSRAELVPAAGGDRSRVDTLKNLERVIAQVALQFDSSQKTQAARLDQSEKRLGEVLDRLEALSARPQPAANPAAGVSPEAIRSAFDAMSARLGRLEKSVSEAPPAIPAPIDPQFAEQTGARLRVLGDEIKRGGDRVRQLETALRKLTEQIDAAERRSADGVQKVAETIAELRTQFAQPDTGDPRAAIDSAIAAVTRRTDERISRLQSAFEDMIARLNAADAPNRAQAEGALADALAAGPSVARDNDEAASSYDLQDAGPRAASTDDDAFSFDLDEPPESVGEPASADDAATNYGDADDDETRSLDAVLKAFDDIDDSPPDAFLAPATDAVDGVERAEQGPPPSTDDFMRRARRAAKDSLEDSVAAHQARDGARKKLSPKQRAILAAKARRRRLEDGGLAVMETRPPAGDPPQRRRAPADAAVAPPNGEKGALSALTERISRLRRRAPDDEFEAAPDNIRAAARARHAMSGRFAKIAGNLTEQPVVTAIGAAVAAGAAAVFLLSRPGEQTAQTSKAPQPSDQADTRIASAAPESDLIIPPADNAIEPRTLFFDSVAKFKNASNEADTEAALTLLKQAAAFGYAPAQLQLGEHYKIGRGLPQDLALARTWYERAANGGNVLAMHKVGVMAARGQGGPVDAEEAIAWFEKAANLGLGDSQYNLGSIFHPGGDIATAAYQDAAQAYYWYSLAARKGDSQAATQAAAIASQLSSEQRASADEAISSWTPQPADAAANEAPPAA